MGKKVPVALLAMVKSAFCCDVVVDLRLVLYLRLGKASSLWLLLADLLKGGDKRELNPRRGVPYNKKRCTSPLVLSPGNVASLYSGD